MKRIFQKKNNYNYISLSVCLSGIVLNLLLSAAASAFNLPIPLDTVGTIAVAMTGGYLPGVIVGFSTCLIKSIFEPSALYYGVFSELIAIVASLLSQKGRVRSFWGVVNLIAVFTLISGGLGSLISLFSEDISLENGTLTGILYRTGRLNAVSSHILSNLILNLADKTASVLLALLVLRIIPQRLYRYFYISWWLQTPVPNDNPSLQDKSRVFSLRTKVLSVLSVSMASVAIIAIVICMRVYHTTTVRDHTIFAQGVARIAAAELDGDAVNEYLQSKGTAEGYSEISQKLENILNSSPDIKYLYVYQIQADGCHVVFDLDTEEAPAEAVGAVIPLDEGFIEARPLLLRGEEVDPVMTNDAYGNLLTVYQPVYDSEDQCVCYVGADVEMEQLLKDESSFLVKLASVFLGFFLMIGILGIWLTRYHVIYPIKSLTDFADGFSNEGATQENLDEFIRKFRSLDIHTGDEIEKLYLALCNMMVNQAEQTRSIRRLSDATSRMQDGLIVTMADLVESRDSDTGAHVQKTAAYVKIIAEGLKKKGYYAEKLTPKFISDVVRSAPLHDVGKINIPDSVLNKPGKLTDEEYAIMKTHTTAGKQIMEHAIGTVGGDSYLKEARNMAAYHHERWDGKGYPEGLHGNVIPLSARIMAVADVFDALASPRVYKPAFPLEKAVAILVEGKGTQFDPKCVEAFLDSLPEVKEVLQKYHHQV